MDVLVGGLPNLDASAQLVQFLWDECSAAGRWNRRVMAELIPVRRLELRQQLRHGKAGNDARGVLCLAGNPGHGSRRTPSAIGPGSNVPARGAGHVYVDAELQ